MLASLGQGTDGGMAIVSRMRATIVLAALAGCCIAAAAPGASAQTTTGASVRPSLLPNRLGASTALTLAFRFSGGEEGVPAPLSGMVLRLPAGLTINLRGAGICAKSQLQRKGAAGCPSSSLVGRGHGLNDVHAGSLTVPEEVTISVFRGPNRGSRPTLQIFSQGETPLDQSSISSAVLEPDGAPYGSKLTMSVPPIPTLMLEPNASFVSLSLTIGGIGRGPRAHAAAGAVLAPRSCPAGGFPFAASFTFADHSAANASATVTCP